jgi:hypothetical protein
MKIFSSFWILILQRFFKNEYIHSHPDIFCVLLYLRVTPKFLHDVKGKKPHFMCSESKIIILA